MKANTMHSKFFWVLSLLLLLISFFPLFGNSALDLQLHDTYLVIGHSQICLILSVITFIIGLIYYLCKWLPLNNWISHLHVLITYCFIGLILITMLMSSGSPRHYYSFDDGTSFYPRLIHFLILSSFLYLLFQVLFLINVFLGLWKSKNGNLIENNNNSSLLDSNY